MAEKIVTNKVNLQILHEDNHIIVVNKRVGDIVQGDKTGDKPLSEVVKEYIKEKYNKPGDVFLGLYIDWIDQQLALWFLPKSKH
jgi:23S rRNA pseudouridine1911/1915/1917 synthase